MKILGTEMSRNLGEITKLRNNFSRLQKSVQESASQDESELERELKEEMENEKKLTNGRSHGLISEPLVSDGALYGTSDANGEDALYCSMIPKRAGELSLGVSGNSPLRSSFSGFMNDVLKLETKLKNIQEENIGFQDLLIKKNQLIHELRDEVKRLNVELRKNSGLKKEDGSPRSPPREDKDSIKKIEKLKEQARQLKFANVKWDEYGKKMQEKEKNLLASNVTLERELIRLKEDMTSKNNDAEKIYGELKKDAESLKVQLDVEREEKVRLTAENDELKKDKGQMGNEIERLANRIVELQEIDEALASQDSHTEKVIKDLQTENEILKSQIQLFHDDFKKEHTDKLTADNKFQVAEKARHDITKQFEATRKEYEKHVTKNNRMDEHIKKMETDLAVVQEKVRTKDAEIQRLKGDLNRHRARQNNQGDNNGDIYVDMDGRDNLGFDLSLPPEFGSWNCRTCTYLNGPQRQDCDVCGSHK